ncbi:peptide-methionine (R)-S-oxide reductase MsrB [Ancylobacter sonchi]|uniref:peptide-methionine (R)-S-oxide reductase MsrB n=1 Tax=Ancylobacter sonchi TaxID=1937790 RepID=UPI001BD4003D|nr:peptide-methionine (R)-S-oxide reductase MsrB [Ancylobacter sonchi]MBS7537192.1 peptide-methionine (R)-S-oxide reductase MsrB [Ancylobacter sonchi]
MADTAPRPKVVKTEAEWRALLTPEQFRVTRGHGTECAFSGPHLSQKEAGTYSCVCCGEPLFHSSAKFESGTGWPSFFQPVSKDAVSAVHDHSHGMHRIEIRCATCDAHLGHVFPDGPRPTGMRFCMNGVALTFRADAVADSAASEGAGER